jgi:hypothetical protein
MCPSTLGEILATKTRIWSDGVIGKPHVGDGNIGLDAHSQRRPETACLLETVSPAGGGKML